MFGIQGLGAYLILVLALVLIWIGLGYEALQVQRDNATNYYSIEESTK
jgi:hypothetical protein